MNLRRFFALVAALATVFLVGGCGTSSNSIARLRVFNAAPGYGLVDIYVGNSRIAENYPYFSTNVQYLDINPATYDIRVFTAGADVTTAIPIYTTRQSFVGGRSYTFALLTKDANPSNGVDGLFLTDETAFPTGNNFRVRVANTSPSVGSVDVYLTAPSASIASVTPNLANLPYKGSATITPDTAAGSFRIRITTAGTKSVLIDTNTIVFNALQARSVLIIGNPGLTPPLPILPVVLTDLN